ncbi:UNVERIFIED_CONTAM: hypothetical protein NCL1_42484 [Trichonephila clavipes]
MQEFTHQTLVQVLHLNSQSEKNKGYISFLQNINYEVVKACNMKLALRVPSTNFIKQRTNIHIFENSTEDANKRKITLKMVKFLKKSSEIGLQHEKKNIID